MKKQILLTITGLLCCTQALLGDATSHQPNSHAPIGVMGEHTHKKGEQMLSYRFMTMSMKDAIKGDKDVSSTDIFDTHGYKMAAAESMTMSMHMLGYMYGFSDKVTLMGMLPYSDNSMTSVKKADNSTFKTSSKGLGDIKVSALINLKNTEKTQSLFSLGLSLPTGKIDEKGTMANGTEGTLGYGMQLGSGTYDLLPGITYKSVLDGYEWGVQAKAVIRTGENDKKYTLGNKLQSTVWGSRQISDTMSTSLRLEYITEGKVDGAHSDIANKLMSPVMDPDNTGGTALNLGFGLNYVCNSAKFNGVRVNTEVILPIQRFANGIQLKREYAIIFGLQKEI